jgi:hypothetical protein
VARRVGGGPLFEFLVGIIGQSNEKENENQKLYQKQGFLQVKVAKGPV